MALSLISAISAIRESACAATVFLNERPPSSGASASWVRGKSGDKLLTGVPVRERFVKAVKPDRAEMSLTGVPDRTSQLKAVKPDKAEISLTGVPLRSSLLKAVKPDKAEISLTYASVRLRPLKAVKPDRAEISLTCVPDSSRSVKAVKLPMSGGSTAKSEKLSAESKRWSAPLASAVAMASCAWA